MLKFTKITEQVPNITAAMSALPWSPDLEARYSFITSFGDVVKMGIREGNTLWVPRETCPISLNDYRVSYEPVAINFNFTPRNEEQDELIKKSVELLKAGQNHIFDAPTGWGKTIAGSVVAARLGQPTFIIVTKEDLMMQWYNSLVHVLGIDASLVGKVQQDVCDWKGKLFVIAMVHSLVIPDRYPAEMFKYPGLVVLDEVHQMAAETFSRACYLFPAKFRIGFSATEKRRDGKSRILYAHIGPVLIHGKVVPMKSRVLVKKTGWKIPVTKRWENGQYVEKKIPHAPGRMMLVIKAMASNQARNQQIVEFVVQAYNADRTILVLSDLIDDHLKKLFLAFTKAGIPGEDIAYYIGGLKKSQLDLAKTSRVVLGTFAMCSTGTDVAKWDSLVMATPRANAKQSAGRVLRYASGKKQPVILDLVDADAIFNNFYLSRLKSYYEIGAEIVSM